MGGGYRTHLELGDAHRITAFSEFQRFEFPPEANPKLCLDAVARVTIRMLTNDAHDKILDRRLPRTTGSNW